METRTTRWCKSAFLLAQEGSCLEGNASYDNCLSWDNRALFSSWLHAVMMLPKSVSQFDTGIWVQEGDWLRRSQVGWRPRSCCHADVTRNLTAQTFLSPAVGWKPQLWQRVEFWKITWSVSLHTSWVIHIFVLYLCGQVPQILDLTFLPRAGQVSLAIFKFFLSLYTFMGTIKMA